MILNSGLFDKDGNELELTDVFAKLSLSKCNRVEVIDGTGRAYVNNNSENKVRLLMQDDFRTMKIFIDKK